MPKVTNCAVCGREVARGPRCQSCAQQARRARSGVERDTELLRQHTEEGKSLRVLAREHGISHERVRKLIRRAIERLPELEKRRLYGDK